jgi:TRAP-type C4-dicarboxylate transport system permease small subunit
MSHTDRDGTETTRRSRTNVFDIRNIIGALMLIYGAVLLVMSFTTSAAEKAKVGGINANLWVGLCLLVAGGLMVMWAVLRPVEIDEAQVEADKRAVEEAAGRGPSEEEPARG